METFHLERTKDPTGVSGTGRVAEGVVLPSGRVVLEWQTDVASSLGLYESLEEVERVHGHNGGTRVVLEDRERPWETRRWLYEILERALGLEVKEGGYGAPHCDALVLHRPTECFYCDTYAAKKQDVRLQRGIPFSGEPGAPDALFRPHHTIRRWSGNVPVKKGEPLTHMGATFIVGEDH